jgi:hypothetical protein
MPTTRSQMLAYSDAASALRSQEQSDWQKAQEQYAQGVKAGYKPEDADAIYLGPVRSKWNVIEQSPELIQSPEEFNKFNEQYDSAVGTFHNNLKNYSRDSGQWAANQLGSINPVLEGASIASRLPVSSKLNTKDESSALDAISKGASALDVTTDNPKLLNSSVIRGLVRQELKGGGGKLSAREAADISVAKANYIQAVNSGNQKEIASAGSILDGLSKRKSLFNSNPDNAEGAKIGDINPTDSESNAAADLTSPGGISMPPPESFSDMISRMQQQPSQTSSPASRRPPVIFITGGKENTVDRAGADAAWQQAHPQSSTSTASPADALSGAQSGLPDFTGTPAPATSQSEPVPYKKGMRPVKGQAYSIGTDKYTYVFDGSKFVAQ